MRFDILSLFPEMFISSFEQSIIKRATERGLLEIITHNIRDYATGKHKVTDDAPYGGGGGMVMKIEPIDKALQAIRAPHEKFLTILLTPQGEIFNHDTAAKIARHDRAILICGHYEGIDERIAQHLVDKEISIGDFVLTGGEIAAMVVVDAVSRLLPGVIGGEDAHQRDSFAMRMLEYPHYTRPAEYRGWKVPDVLLSGHQKMVDEWRHSEALKRTRARRPDLLAEDTPSDAALAKAERTETPDQ